ncbi:hypothetical protein E2C01_042878 [Portunus trituberculatus]|uniref:Uncharacterized protein n=1 Tax=Portunus trituberculatus TaxID=210409 RepID=A0A5B7FXP6_PORTR|nr:hypothetical protein [Portunus trituberculatus]
MECAGSESDSLARKFLMDTVWRSPLRPGLDMSIGDV